MNPIKIFNTLSGKKEPLKKSGEIKLFVCGPTVYDDAHLGHAKTYIAFDILVRYLRSRNLKVFYLQNITDVDDKIIERARKEKKPVKRIVNLFFKNYLRDMKLLGVSSVNRYAEASRFIPEIVGQIQILIKKGYAYKTGDGWYFDLSTFPDYGKLSKRKAAEAADAVSRIDESVKKRNKGDFCLWKFSKTGEPSWKTPLGGGRPGWHIEDTAIAVKFFGPQYDIHGGAVDLKFPHHEAEIAQAESATGKKPYVKIWAHTGFLTVGGEKMSKSSGNFVTIRNFLKKYDKNVLRFMMSSAHYRSPIDYSESLARKSKKSLETIAGFLGKLKITEKTGIKRKGKENISKLKFYEKKFGAALANDFNTPEALAEIFKFISERQAAVWRFTAKEAKAAADFIKGKLAIFGIQVKPSKIPAAVKALANRREKLRRNKQFIQADALRKKIESLGYKVEDTPLGPYIRKNF